MPPNQSNHRPRRVFLGAWACALALGWASCGGETAVEKANRDGILIIGNSSEPKSLDPHIVSGVLENTIIRSMFEGLVIEHPSQDGVALPGVAETWESNEDASEWTFHLRKDAVWSDGTPLTTEDFLFAFRRILTPALASDYSFMLYYMKDAEAYHKQQRSYLNCRTDESFPVAWETLKKVDFGESEDAELAFNKKGLDHLDIGELKALRADPSLFAWPDDVSQEVRDLLIKKNLAWAESGGDLWDLIELGAKATDAHTLVVTLNGPIPFLPEITKHYTWFPIPKHVVLKYGGISEKFTGWTKPENLVSNGVFKLKSWRFNDHIEVERNPLYWDKEWHKVDGSLKGIRFLPIANYYTETRMFYDGQMHLTYRVPPELVAYSTEHYPDQIKSDVYLGCWFVRTNVTRTPFNNQKVRLAFSLAVDQKALVENVTLGNEPPATGLVPKLGAYPASDVIKFDPEQARKLLAEAGFPGGVGLPDIEFLTTDRETAKAIAEALQAMWKEHLGANVKIRQMEWTSYITEMFDRKYDLAFGGWIGDYLDPLTFLDMWMKDGGNNRTGWWSEEFEKLIAQAGETGDADARYKILKQAEELLLEERPVIPLYWAVRNYMKHPALKGWDPLILDNHPYKFIRLQED